MWRPDDLAAGCCIACCSLANAYFVAYEFGVIVAKRSSFESPDGGASRASKAALESFSNVSEHLAGAQLGITMASLGLGYVAEPAIGHIFEEWLGRAVSEEVASVAGLVLALALVVFLHLVVGEMIPKNIAIADPNRTMRLLALPYKGYLWVSGPVVRFLNALANAGLKAIGVEPRDELVAAHSVAELTSIVIRSREGGALDAEDAEMLNGALEFARRPVIEVARPLAEVPKLRLGATVAQAERAVRHADRSRLVIVTGSGNEERILGYIHAKDLLRIPPGDTNVPIPVSFTRQMVQVRSDRTLVEALRLMRSARRQLAVVVSDGNPVGVVSVEELVRAILPLQAEPIARVANN